MNGGYPFDTSISERQMGDHRRWAVPPFRHHFVMYRSPLLGCLFNSVRRQGFWNQWGLKLRESLAHLVGFDYAARCL